MDTAQWPQEARLVVKPPMEGVVLPSAATACSARPQVVDRRPRPQKEHALNCPRCQSTDTKFCYYNNYSHSQPRYFCKTCRRYWTEGGSLRNVPVGGGSRKNKRSSCFAMATVPTSSSSSATSAKKPPDLTPPPHSSSGKNPKFHEGQDLNFAFPQSHMSGEFVEFHNMESAQSSITNPNPSACSSAAATSDNTLSAMELLRGEISARGLSPFVPMVMATPGAGAVYPPGFGLPDFRSNTLLSFPVDGIGGGGGYGNVQGVQDGGGRVFFPFDNLRQVSSVDSDIEQAKAHGGDPSAFWNGAGASW